MYIKTVKYEVGEVYLTGSGIHLREMEIKQISNNAKAVKTQDGWTDASDFLKTVKGKLGHYEYKKGFFKTRRVFVATLER